MLMNFCAFFVSMCLLHHSSEEPVNLLERGKGRFCVIS